MNWHTAAFYVLGIIHLVLYFFIHFRGPQVVGAFLIFFQVKFFSYS